MRTLLLICILFAGLGLNAQNHGQKKGHHGNKMERPDFTPEQVAEIRTKELTLLLDLNSKQQDAIKALELSAAKERHEKRTSMKESEEKPSDEEKFQHITERLDKKIAFKKSMKSILDNDQFEKWEKSMMAREKKNRRRNHHRSREGRR